ncbi:MAG: hypothetical protein HUU15_02235 [Candidatus Brocadiae bacterium]|nr:hypothetical protein [Candidatus Brocadiia bacterium]
MDLSPILGKLDAVRRRARSLILIDGLSRVALVLVVAVVFSFLVDYLVPKVPHGVRLTVLGLGVAAAVAAFWRYVVAPLSVNLTDDDLALCVERQYPGLNDRLISALQLSRQRGEFDRFNSPELVDRLVAEAMTESRALDFSPVVLPRGPMRLLGWTAGAFLAVGAVAAWQAPLVKIWAARLFSDSVSWPKKTRIVVHVPVGNPVTIAKGDDLVVEIEIQGSVPKKSMIRYRFSGADSSVQRLMRADNDGRWRFEFTKVIEPLEFWVEAGDDETLPVSVQVLNPPTVEQVALVYDYPAYTGLADTDPTRPVHDGNIVAPLGTKVKVTGTTNLDVVAAKVLFGRRGEEEVRDLPVQNDAQGRPRVVTADIDVLRSTQYAIWLHAANGLQTSAPVRYSIKATDDKAPEIRVNEPNLDKFCTPTARIPIRIVTTDDFGVASLALLIRAPGKTEATIPLDAFNTESYPSRRIETEYWFDMAEFGAKEGMVIQYQVIAKDGRELPAPNMTQSRVYLFTVIKRDEMLKKIEDMLARIREELRRIIAFEEAGRADVARLMDALGERDLLEVHERQALSGAGSHQRRITQHLERVTHEFDEIVKDMRHNRLFEGQGEDKLRRPGEVLHAVTEQKSPDAAQLLVQAASVALGKDRTSRLAETAARQDEIISDLNSILGLLTEYETYMEVVRYVREMLNKAEKTREEMRKPK